MTCGKWISPTDTKVGIDRIEPKTRRRRIGVIAALTAVRSQIESVAVDQQPRRYKQITVPVWVPILIDQPR